MKIKHHDIANTIERRVKRGDYILNGFPGERELASEQGVSPMTARKAVQALLERNVLIRKSNGRLQANPAPPAECAGKQLQVGFLAPAFDSHVVSIWLSAITKVAEASGAILRPMFYVHWEDSMVWDAMNSFDGLFLVSIGEKIPSFLEGRLRDVPTCLVSLDLDLSYLDIPSICLFPAPSVQQLLSHLQELGHRRIDCLQTQPMNTVIAERVAQWRIWCEMTGTEGKLHDHAVRPYEQPLHRAYDVMEHLLQTNSFDATALLCTTEPAAIGSIRAIHNHGLVVGRDISVCAINDEGFARYLTPTITSLEMVNPEPYVSICLKWMDREKSQWNGPYTLQPAQAPLFVGESTGPVRKQ